MKKTSTFQNGLIWFGAGVSLAEILTGTAYCFYKDKHLALDLVKGRAKGAFNVVLSVFIEAAIVFFVGYVL